MMKSILLPSILLVLFVAPVYLPSYSSRPISAKLIKVVDGDTVWVSRNGRRIKLRLIYIDAPEIKQLSLDGFAVGEWSKAFLDRALGEKISFINHGRDRYGRTLAELFWRGQNLNYELVAAGFSFVYKFAKFKSSTQKRRFIRAFYHAHSLNLGMWSTTGVMNPYNWRKIRQ